MFRVSGDQPIAAIFLVTYQCTPPRVTLPWLHIIMKCAQGWTRVKSASFPAKNYRYDVLSSNNLDIGKALPKES